MLTNDRNTQVLVNRIIANKFEINLIRITISKGDEKLCGRGIVYQDDEGQLQLKFFSDYEYSQNERLRMMLGGGKASYGEGGIKSEFYVMEGKDENCREYSCNQIDLRNLIDNVMDFRLLAALNCPEKEGSSTRVILVGKYRIPSTNMINRLTKIDESFWFTDNEDIWEIVVDENLKIFVTNYDNYMDVLIHVIEEIDFADVDNILDSLNFVLGTELEPVFINVINKGHKVQNRSNMLKATSIFSAPFTSDHNYGNDFTVNHNKIFCAYFNYICKDSMKLLPKIHRRIVSGSRNYLYAAALILSVQIEKICKDYFSLYYIADEDFTKALKECVDLICNSNINEKNKITGLLKNKIPNGSRNDFSVRNILKNLAHANVISKSLIEKWESLRNITAHGDTYEGDEVAPLLENWFFCTNLYYQLIFNLIGYEGLYSWKEFDNNRLESYPIIV